MVSHMRGMILLLLGGCHWTVPSTPTARVQTDGEHPPPRILAAFPVECVACTPQQLGAIATETRMGLELSGYSVVDSELVNAEARVRFTHTTNDRSEVSVDGTRGWDGLAPGQQADLLTAMGVDGVLRTSIAVHGVPGPDYSSTITVTLAVARIDGAVAWRTDCSVVSDGIGSTMLAIERASRCAIESKELW